MSQKNLGNGTRQPVIVTAACKYGDVILCGARHYDSVMLSQLRAMPEDGAVRSMPRSEVVQGFIDQFGNFYNRKEAMQTAKASGRFIDFERNGGNGLDLYSEGLH